MPSIITKVQGIDRDLIVKLVGSPDQRSALLASFAREKLQEARDQNQQATGVDIPYRTIVDGKVGASEDQVKPDNGVIVYAFDIISDSITWILTALYESSPIGSGRDPHPGLYQKSHILIADGVEVLPGTEPPPAREYVILNTTPYARKIEHGHSKQFPDGVYESIAAIARTKFGNTSRIEFNYRGQGKERAPAIIITPR